MNPVPAPERGMNQHPTHAPGFSCHHSARVPCPRVWTSLLGAYGCRVSSYSPDRGQWEGLYQLLLEASILVVMADV